jgi:hypothetical protein
MSGTEEFVRLAVRVDEAMGALAMGAILCPGAHSVHGYLDGEPCPYCGAQV